jgi:large repetitive protein
LAHHRYASALLAITLCICASTSASAQRYEGFTLDRFQLTPTPEDGLALQLPSTLGPKRWSARLALAYQNDPLVSGVPSGSDVAVVADHLALHMAGAVGLGERFELFALVPVVVYQSGEQQPGSGLLFPTPRKSGFGDPVLGASAHLLGERERGPQLGLNAALLVPIGSGTTLASDGGAGLRATISGALVLPVVTLAIETGAAYRPHRELAFLDSGSELLIRAGAYVPIADRFRLLAELNGATRLGDGKTFDTVASPLEMLLGGEYRMPGGLNFGLGIGPGLTLGTGTPAVRVLGMVGYASPLQKPLEEPSEPPPEPEPEPEPPAPPADSDGDGMADPDDRCPTAAEDKDGVEDTDGCPDVDLDTDGDGLRDPIDRCPAEAETVNSHEDEDGCPDQPPAAAPPPPPAAVEFQPLLFPANFTSVRPEVVPALESALKQLNDNPQLRIAIDGHSSNDGKPELNQKLSEKRALAVYRWLVEHGIAKDRLETRSFGSSQPAVPGDDADARNRNRRVELHILPP